MCIVFHRKFIYIFFLTWFQWFFHPQSAPQSLLKENITVFLPLALFCQLQDRPFSVSTFFWETAGTGPSCLWCIVAIIHILPVTWSLLLVLTLALSPGTFWYTRPWQSLNWQSQQSDAAKLSTCILSAICLAFLWEVVSFEITDACTWWYQAYQFGYRFPLSSPQQWISVWLVPIWGIKLCDPYLSWILLHFFSLMWHSLTCFLGCDVASFGCRSYVQGVIIRKHE